MRTNATQVAPPAVVHTHDPYTIAQIQERTGIPRGYLYDALNNGLLIGFHLHGDERPGGRKKWRVRAAELDVWLDRNAPRFPSQVSA